MKDKLQKKQTNSPAFTIQQLLIEQERKILVKKDYEERECALRHLEEELQQRTKNQISHPPKETMEEPPTLEVAKTTV